MEVEVLTDSTFDLFVTTLAWVLNNSIWNLLIDTGIFLIPIAINFVHLFMKVREQGADEGNKGALLLNWFENYGYFTVLFLFATCIPIFNVNFGVNEASYTDDCKKIQQSTNISETPFAQGFKNVLKDKDNADRKAKMPLWWAFTYVVSKGLVGGLNNTIPCQLNFRQIKYEIDKTTISSPVLREELARFRDECYEPARSRLLDTLRSPEYQNKYKNGIPKSMIESMNWVGSKMLIEGDNLYNTIRSRQPVAGMNSEELPTCKDWWTTPSIGLRDRLITQFPDGSAERYESFFQRWLGIGKKMTTDEANETLLRNTISEEKMKLSKDAEVYGNEYNNNFTEARKTVDTLAASWKNLWDQSIFDITARQGKFIKSMVSFFLIVLMPIIIVASGYQPKPFLTITFAFLGLELCMFIWNLVMWLDNWLIDALNSSELKDTSMWDIRRLQINERETSLQYVIGIMYTFGPVLLLTFFSWAGFKLGTMMHGELNNSYKQGENVSNDVKKGAMTAVKSSTKAVLKK